MSLFFHWIYRPTPFDTSNNVHALLNKTQQYNVCFWEPTVKLHKISLQNQYRFISSALVSFVVLIVLLLTCLHVSSRGFGPELVVGNHYWIYMNIITIILNSFIICRVQWEIRYDLIIVCIWFWLVGATARHSKVLKYAHVAMGSSTIYSDCMAHCQLIGQPT